MPEQANSVRDAYDRSALFYDKVTQADDYDRWVGLYLDLLREHGSPSGRLVDLGCGTGKAALRLAAQGFEVTGVDLSPEMLEVARAKQGAERVRFVTGDLRDLPERLGPFDVAVALGEPLNHLADEEELLAAFRGVARLLQPAGLFVFDLNTSAFYERIAAVQQISDHDEVLVLQRGAPSHRRTGGADLHVDHFHRDSSTAGGADRWIRTSVVHSWAYFAPADVERTLLESGFTLVADYGLGRTGLHPMSDESADRKRLVVARADAGA